MQPGNCGLVVSPNSDVLKGEKTHGDFKDLVLKIVTYLCNVLILITYCNDVLEICVCVCVWRGVCPRVCKNPEEGWDGNLPALSLKG